MAARGADAAVDMSSAERSVGREALRACRLFAGVEDATLDRCAAAMRTRRFRRGEVIFHVDDPGDSLFVVTAGSVKIVVPPHDGTDPAILTTIGPGGFFGELALFDGAPRSATAIALDAVATLVLRRDAFEALLDDEPEMRRALLVSLAGEIRRLTAQVEDLHFLDLPGRLAHHLLRQVGWDGDAPDRRAARPVAVHAGRARRDDRGRPPVREPAARRLRRPGPAALRGRRPRDPGPRPPGRRRPPVAATRR